MMRFTGRIEHTSRIRRMCSDILASTEGASHPLCLERTLLLNLDLRYLVLRYLLARRYARRSDRFFVMSFLSSASAA